MGGSLGKKKISTHDKAILDLKIQRDKLMKYQKQIQNVLDRETEIAKSHLRNGDKKRAILVLKKKKYQVQLIEQTETQILNVEELVNSIEYALVEQKVIEGLKKGNEVLTQLNNAMKIEDVEKLMEDTADAIAYQREIDAVLKGSLSEVDQQEIENELEQMLRAEEIKLPDVPKTEPKISEKPETAAVELEEAKEKQRNEPIAA